MSDSTATRDDDAVADDAASSDAPQDPWRDDAVLLAVGAELADTFGLGSDVALTPVWPLDDGDRVLAAEISGEWPGRLLLGVNGIIAKRLLGDPDRLTAGFRRALAAANVESAGVDAVSLDQRGDDDQPPKRVVEVRSEGQICAVVGIEVEEPPVEAEAEVIPDRRADAVASGATAVKRRPVVAVPERRIAAYGILDDVVVTVSVELGRTSMTLRDVLALRPGMVIELGRPADEPIDLMVDHRRVAGGEAVVVGEMFGIQLTDVAFEVPDRSHSLAERPAS